MKKKKDPVFFLATLLPLVELYVRGNGFILPYMNGVENYANNMVYIRLYHIDTEKKIYLRMK